MKLIQRSLLILCLLPILLAAACALASTPLPGAMATEATASGSLEMPATGAELTGASLYQLSCAACHGQDRAGSTFEMDGQTVKVPELTWDDLNKMYSTNVSRGNVHDQLVLAITKGQNEDGEDMPSMMPRWSSLTQGQVDSLIQYIQSTFK